MAVRRPKFSARKKDEPALPAVPGITEPVAAAVLQALTETGDIEAACAACNVGVTPVAFMFWIEQNERYRNGFRVAKEIHAEHVAREARRIAEEPVPWDEWNGMELPEMKLRMDAHFKRQEARIKAAQDYARRIAPAQATPPVSVNVDARSSPVGEAYGATLRRVSAARELLEHDGGDGK